MLLNWLKAKHSDSTIKRIIAAYPSHLSKDVSIVLEDIPVAEHNPSRDDIGPVMVNGENLLIPFRVYFSELKPKSMLGMSEIQKAIVASLYARHNNGYVREKYLRQIIHASHNWVPPFILQLLGEYLIEIIRFLEDNRELLKTEVYSQFIRENPAFCLTVCRRVISFWDCYFRWNNNFLNDHSAYKTLKEIGMWHDKISPHIVKR